MKNYIINSGHVKLFNLKEKCDFEEIKYTKKEELMKVKCKIDKELTTI